MLCAPNTIDPNLWNACASSEWNANAFLWVFGTVFIVLTIVGFLVVWIAIYRIMKKRTYILHTTSGFLVFMSLDRDLKRSVRLKMISTIVRRESNEGKRMWNGAKVAKMKVIMISIEDEIAFF